MPNDSGFKEGNKKVRTEIKTNKTSVLRLTGHGTLSALIGGIEDIDRVVYLESVAPPNGRTEFYVIRSKLLTLTLCSSLLYGSSA